MVPNLRQVFLRGAKIRCRLDEIGHAGSQVWGLVQTLSGDDLRAALFYSEAEVLFLSEWPRGQFEKWIEA
jgi:hypothetical protein